MGEVAAVAAATGQRQAVGRHARTCCGFKTRSLAGGWPVGGRVVVASVHGKACISDALDAAAGIHLQSAAGIHDGTGSVAGKKQASSHCESRVSFRWPCTFRSPASCSPCWFAFTQDTGLVPCGSGTPCAAGAMRVGHWLFVVDSQAMRVRPQRNHGCKWLQVAASDCKW